VILSPKLYGTVSHGGDTTDQMYSIADLADQYSFGELRAIHQQNLVLADVKQAKLYEPWQEAKKQKVLYPTWFTY
jgi:sulfite reductase (NADPH) hemoprotein beta-component